MESAIGRSLTATRMLLVLVSTIKNGSRNQLQLVSAQCVSYVQRVYSIPLSLKFSEVSRITTP
jgi:hypothetical protein